MSRKIRIATRGSQLALWQAEYVSELLRGQQLDPELLIIKTQGDRVQDRFLHEMGGKGLFIKELEQAMADGKADCAVHSLKDLPAKIPEGFELPAILKRHSPRDILIFNHQKGIEFPSGRLSVQTLKEKGAIEVATASLRRQALLKKHCPELKPVAVRGNVDTRIRKLFDENWDGLILAEASIERLQIQGIEFRTLDDEWFLPSPAQGALAIEAPLSSKFRDEIRSLNDVATENAVTIERTILARLGGDCTMPFACLTEPLSDGGVRSRSLVLNHDGEAASADLRSNDSIEGIDCDATASNMITALRQDGVEKILADLDLKAPDLGPLK